MLFTVKLYRIFSLMSSVCIYCNDVKIYHGKVNTMYVQIIRILMIPFLGTVLGSVCVFFTTKTQNQIFAKSMNGFAAGVMIASSVWSLIIPAIELSAKKALPAFFPAAIGFWIGIIFFFVLDKLLDKIKTTNPASDQNRYSLTLIAIIVHNLPEGMALGVMCIAGLSSSPAAPISTAIALAVGIGIQNFPEGAIISVPLHINGKSKALSFAIGVLSAIAETLGSLVMIAISGLVVPVLPYVMCFAAGAMIFVVINELCPEISEGKYIDIGTFMFSVGFSVMMILDVALG